MRGKLKLEMSIFIDSYCKMSLAAGSRDIALKATHPSKLRPPTHLEEANELSAFHEVGSDLPKVLFKVLFWAPLKVFLLRKVLFNVLKKVLQIV